ncbi:MAG: MmgE/PrpD family protein, partial [Solirubrobacteraceae bacterium]
MTVVAGPLAAWAAGLEPSDDDLALARRSLVDTVAVAIAARAHPIADLLGELPEGEAWAVLAHVLDFDDLHMESTSHVS